jgi:CubicO group peptidase (beta-lactamase class C family)
MKLHLDPTRALALALCLVCIGPKAAELPPAPSQADVIKAGFSPQRLARLDAAIEAEIESQQLAGAVMYIARDGRPVHFKAYGQQDIENQRPMQRDAIFRIASMSKAITSVAAMMLYEEGRFLLKDPVAKFLPEFSQAQVAMPAPKGSDQPYLSQAPHRPLLIRDLLRHTAGMSYGAGPAAAAYQQAGFTDWYILGRPETLAQWVKRLATLPLQGQPGEVWQYGFATDVLGRLIEVVSGQPLDRFIAERITGPLGMVDTSFFLPEDKLSRLTHVYGMGPDGRLRLQETAASSDFVHGPRMLFSGGAGLLSTTTDYARFLQMLLNGGELDGQRLLSPKTVELMRADHVGELYRQAGGTDADGFGLGFWVTAKLGAAAGELSSEGAFGWGSAYFPQYAVDPKERMIILFMAQHRPAGHSKLHLRVKTLSYQALVR